MGAPSPGARLGPYRLVDQLGHGGMGCVFRARHEEAGVEHAVKLILVMGEGTQADRVVARFRREAEVLAKLASAHPAIVKIHSFGVDARDRPWFSMDLVEGRGLDDVLGGPGGGPLRPRDAARLVAEIARAVHAAHERGIVHRDIKPANVVVDRDGRPRLLDFGLASDEAAASLTRTGQILGTPVYMAPEQIAPSAEEPVGPATDVYGLGATLYEALTGVTPVGDGHSPAHAIIRAVLVTRPTAPSRRQPGVPAELDAICARALAKRPADRFTSALELASALEAFLASEGTPDAKIVSRRPTLVAAGLAVVLAAAVIASASWQLRPKAAETASVAPILDRIEDELRGRGARLPRPLREQLEAISGRRDLTPGDADRVRFISAIQVLAHPSTRGPAAEQAGTDLLETVRSRGRLDLARFDLARDVLSAAGRHRLLFELAFEHDPPARVVGDPAAVLARLAVSDPALPVPRDEACFDALYGADGLDDDARAALLRRRAGGLAAAGDASGAVAAALQVGRRHGTLVDPSSWPVGAVARLQHELIAALAAGRLEEAELLLAVLVRAPAPPPPPPDATVVDLHVALRGSQVGWKTGDSRSIDAVLLTAGLLEMHGLSPLGEGHIVDAWGVDDQSPLWSRLEACLEQPAARRDPVILLVGERFLRMFDDRAPSEGRKRLIVSAMEAGVRAFWFRALVAQALSRSSVGYEVALQALEPIIREEQARPAAERWPALTEAYVDMLVDLADLPADAENLVDALHLFTGLPEGQPAARALVDRIVAAGGDPPWIFDREVSLADELADLVRKLNLLGDPACCDIVRVTGAGDIVAVMERWIELARANGDETAEVINCARELADLHWAHGRRLASYRATVFEIELKIRRARAHDDPEALRDTLWHASERLSRYVFRLESIGEHSLAALVADRAITLAWEVRAASLRPDPLDTLALARLHLQREACHRRASLEAAADGDRAAAWAIVDALEHLDPTVEVALAAAREGRLDPAAAAIDEALAAIGRTPPGTALRRATLLHVTRAFIRGLAEAFERGEDDLSDARFFGWRRRR